MNKTFKATALLICMASPCMPSAAHAATPGLTIEQAIAQARQRVNGAVLSAIWQCDTPLDCGFNVQIQDDASQLHVIRVRAEANTPVAVAPTPKFVAGRPTDEQGLSTHSFATLTFGAGQIAGLGNVILDPLLEAGGRMELRHASFPRWSADGSVRLIYGRTESSDPVTLRRVTNKPELQEVRGSGHLFYDFHQEAGVEKVGVGLYMDFARALHSFPRYVPPQVDSVYAAEEGEVALSTLDTGIDLRLALTQQRIQSSLHNVLFLGGTRIAPNLLTYKPMLGFMWSNEFAITGTIDQPGWSLLTDMDFYFARKAGVRYFNSHDGLGGTKRELDLSYGLAYSISPKTRITVQSYGYNNLNRGSSSMVPVGFKDGLRVGLRWSLD